MRGADRQTQYVSRFDGAEGHNFGRGALSVGEMRLADLLPHGHDDALPPDHRAKTQRKCHRDFHPDRDEGGHALEALLIRANCGSIQSRRQRVRLDHPAERL